MPTDPDAYRKFVLAEIERCRRAFETGNSFSALLQGLDYCEEIDTCPSWIVSALRSIIRTEIADGEGEVGRWFKQHRQDLIDFIRADFIDAARRHGFTWEQAAAFAAEYFGPTPASAEPDAMLKSCQNVNRRRGDEPGRYYTTRADRWHLEEFEPPSAHAMEVFRKHTGRVRKAGRYIEDPDHLLDE